jgi:hypothetical protein
MANKDFPSDEHLRLAVLDALATNEQTGVLEIRVGVINAVAHLGGSAPSLVLWELAQDIAAQVLGIRGVVNRIAAPGAPAPSRIIHLDLPTGSPSREPSQPQEQKETSNEKQS